MNKESTENKITADFHWHDIDTVLLDMDGTLLDKYFDDYFWEEYVPLNYAKENGLTLTQATDELMGRYRAVESTLNWTDLGYWTEQLGLDIPALKREVNHLVDVHPHVIEFLDFITGQEKRVSLVTAAHNTTLQIKMEKVSLTPYFQDIVCTEDIGLPKEDPRFWAELETKLGFDRDRTLLADDTEKVLKSAQHHGIAQLIHVAKPSSRSAIRYSEEFASIVFFNELTTTGY